MPRDVCATYYFAAIVQTVLHRVFGHHDRIHAVYETHAKGHHGKYPPHRLIADEWLDSEQHVMWYYAIPFVPAALAVLWFFGPWLFGSHVLAMVFAIWWHIYLHKQYHLRGSRWSVSRGFSRSENFTLFITGRSIKTTRSSNTGSISSSAPGKSLVPTSTGKDSSPPVA